MCPSLVPQQPPNTVRFGSPPSFRLAHSCPSSSGFPDPILNSNERKLHRLLSNPSDTKQNPPI
eukprot:m.299828 g.299828  ORF g.299828 m.299828 type:complete len:63 (+) comp55198_c0_seq4:188-376(+)